MRGSHRRRAEVRRAARSSRIRVHRVLLAALSVAVVGTAVGLDRSQAFDQVSMVDRAESTPPVQHAETETSSTPSPTSRSGRSSWSPSPAATSAPRVPTRGSGELAIVPGTASGSTQGSTFTYRVEVEQGLPFEGTAVAEKIHLTLTDARSWQELKGVSFERVDSDAELRIILASPDTVDRLCAPLDTDGKVSCRIADRVVLNARRWALGTPDYRGRIDAYRSYLVNHEVGHALGETHVDCPGPGELAPVMMQQTKGVGACRPNPWPVTDDG